MPLGGDQLRTRTQRPRSRVDVPAAAHPHAERLPAGARRPQRM